ncbi:MAG: T9SS type A sorting domain-containing protein, partial [candidate division WOR-3 bacterium]|nr:T9SS type A sorting domain-containing protein [candidate division WOR-3 bacterium]
QPEGWMEVQLDTPFVYNNTQNLQILIIKGFQQYISTTVCPYYRYTTTSPTYRTRQAASDASQPTSLNQTYNRPNIRFTIVSAQGVTENIPNNLPLETKLYAPRPNPAINGLAKISFVLAQPSWTKLSIYDASGRILKTLVNTYLQSGTYNLVWDGRDNNYKKVGNGIYFLRLQTDNYNEIKKINIIK